jgi:hypothetical protein
MPPTARLQELLRAVEQLGDDEMRQLPLVLGDKLKALDQARAAELRDCIGARCDVIWPGEAEYFDATLIGVDEDAGLARISLSRNGPVWSVPPYAVRLD